MNTSNIDTLAMAADEERAKMMHAEEERKKNSTGNGTHVFSRTVTGSPAAAATTQVEATAQLSQSVSKPPSSRRKPKPTFPDRLHAVLSNRSLSDIIAWLPSGKSFCILNKDEFTKKILPMYFKESKFASFDRRLKRWGFRKAFTTGQKQVILTHDLFQKDRLDLGKMMTAAQGSGGVVQQQVVIRGSDRDDSKSKKKENRNDSGLASFSFGNSLAHQEVVAVPQEQLQLQTRPRLPTHHQRAPLVIPSPAYAQVMPTFATNHVHDSASMLRNNNLYSPRHFNPPYIHMLEQSRADANELSAIEQEIQDCQEQLAILHRLRALREKRRVLV
eukprot:scaffold62892_cov45-Cyclotella_meneghiniana.AAC.1